MKAYQEKLLQLILETPGVLDARPYEQLVDGRASTYKLMFDGFSRGDLLTQVGDCYAEHLLTLGIRNNPLAILHGIPEKGREFATATSIALAHKGVPMRYFSLREHEKTHGIPNPENILERWVVERNLHEGDWIYQLDDVITAAKSKILRTNRLRGLARFSYPYTIIGVDREELVERTQSGVEYYYSQTGVRPSTILRVSDVCKGALDMNKRAEAEAIAAQLKQYGTKEAKEAMSRLGL